MKIIKLQTFSAAASGNRRRSLRAVRFSNIQIPDSPAAQQVSSAVLTWRHYARPSLFMTATAGGGVWHLDTPLLRWLANLWSSKGRAILKRWLIETMWRFCNETLHPLQCLGTTGFRGGGRSISSFATSLKLPAILRQVNEIRWLPQRFF